jgi:hypothetical protein
MNSQIFSGQDPFYKQKSDLAVWSSVMAGRRPDRPSADSGLDDAMWDLIELFWKQLPEERPTASVVVAHLRVAHLRSHRTHNEIQNLLSDWDETLISRLKATLGHPLVVEQQLSLLGRSPGRSLSSEK